MYIHEFHKTRHDILLFKHTFINIQCNTKKLIHNMFDIYVTLLTDIHYYYTHYTKHILRALYIFYIRYILITKESHGSLIWDKN